MLGAGIRIEPVVQAVAKGEDVAAGACRGLDDGDVVAAAHSSQAQLNPPMPAPATITFLAAACRRTRGRSDAAARVNASRRV